MRTAALFCACCAALVSTGCIGTSGGSRSLEREQWDALCRNMPQRRVPVSVDLSAHTSRRVELDEALIATGARSLNSVVRIKTLLRGTAPNVEGNPRVQGTSTRSGGTGIVIAANGLILTNEHIVRRAMRITVVLHDGSEHLVESVVVDPRLDLAVVRIARSGLVPLRRAARIPASGASVVAVSCSRDHREHHYRLGLITDTETSLQRELDPAGRRNYSRLIESTTQLDPGFSGGPLLDSSGYVIGINVAATGDSFETLGYAIPFDETTRLAVSSLVARAESQSTQNAAD